MAEKYKNPALTVDIIIFSIIEKTLKILLIKRKNPPFQDKWAIPGGFADYEEEILTAAKRELEEETGLKNIPLEQVHTFGTPGRDPRGRTVSVVHFGLVDSSTGLQVKADSDAKDAQWLSVQELPEMAFDHAEIVKFTLNFLRQKLENTAIVKQIMPKTFSLGELQEVYEVILNKKFNPGEFGKKITETGLLEKKNGLEFTFRENVEFTSKFN